MLRVFQPTLLLAYDRPIAVSLLTAPPKVDKIVDLTYATASAEQKKENRQSWNYVDVIGTIVVLSLVLGMYLYISFWLN
jgi:SSS family solute:Na+ symporter